MTHDEIEHIIRAAGAILNEAAVIVVGSQAILGWAASEDLPAEATYSIEADIVPFHDPDGTKADLIDGTIGEGSPFHERFHIYAQGVSRRTSRLPRNWESRLIPRNTAGTHGVTGWFLDPYDLVIAKYLANRPKDQEFCRAVVGTGLLDQQVLIARLQETDATDEERYAVSARIRRHFEAK